MESVFLSKRSLWSLLAAACTLLAAARPAAAYIDAPPTTLGRMCQWSTHIISVRLEEVDRVKGIVVWRKLKDLKGKWPGGEELITQRLVAPGDQAIILPWAEVGKTTLIFALESYRWSHTYIDKFWYASNTPDWKNWTVGRVETQVLRTYCGRTEKLQTAVAAILADREVIVPCMSDDKPQELAQRRGKVQMLRSSLKRLDYNVKRDFVSWGGDDVAQPTGMRGFSALASLNTVGPFAQAISAADFDGDGKLDLCLSGGGRTSLFQNAGETLLEIDVPGLIGSRGAQWADYNGDQRPDLLLTTAVGPKLMTNTGSGTFRDDTASLPKEPGWNLQAAAWIDYDSDGRTDLVLANGIYGLHLYRNAGPLAGATVGPWKFEDVTNVAGLSVDDLGPARGDTLSVADINGDDRPDVIYGADGGLVLENLGGLFRELAGGLRYQTGKAGPVLCDFDHGGLAGVFVPQAGGASRLFRNDGTGRFLDVTAKSGHLAKPIPNASCAAWGDLDNDGHPDLLIGCLKAPNRFFRNRGDGTFEDATRAVGFDKRIFNTQAICLIDLNRDGSLDAVLNNEGQDSVVLFGNAPPPRDRTPVVLQGIAGTTGRAQVFRGDAMVANEELGGAEGRGSQATGQLRMFLEPGRYRLEVRTSPTVVATRPLLVGRSAIAEPLLELRP